MVEQQQQTVTMMSEEEAPEVGPNDIVIHLVNPYKCGYCDLEFLDKTVFKDHMFSHLEQMKQERPSSQIVMNISLPPETPGGVTVTRDILQLGEDGSIKQVLQPTNNLTLNQVSPLRELEEAGVLRLDPPKPQPTKPGSSLLKPVEANQKTLLSPNSAAQTNTPTKSLTTNAGVIKIEGEDGEETEVSEIVDNKDGSFSVAFKGPNNEMQHIQILKPEGMKGEMMIELTSASGKRRNSRGGTVNKNNECDICGKVLSSSTNLLRHKMYHRAERPFVCEVCNKGFKDVSNLKKHTQIHKRMYPCFLCKKSFLLKSLLMDHLKRHEARTTFVKTGNTTKEVMVRTYVDDDGTRVEEMNMASLGNKTFEYRHRIVKADPSEIVKEEKSQDDSTIEETKDPESAELVEAAQGAEGSEKESTLHKTLLAKVTGEQAEETEVTNNVLTEGGQNSNEPIDVDAAKVPSTEEFVKVYQCGHCGKRTVQRGNMMRHIIHHLKDKPFGCDECPKKFVDKGELVKHKKTHTKPVRCRQCNGAFAHNRQLLKHLEGECLGNSENLNYTVLEDGQTYKCDICHIEMKRLGNIIKHVNTHTFGPKKRWQRRHRRAPTKGFPMKGPGAPYYFDHMRNKFVCNFCDAAFNQKSNADVHARAHRSGKYFNNQTFHKPYKCDICSMAFSRKLFLESHKRKHEDKGKSEETADYGILEDKTGYYCKHCDKKLPQKYRMMSHIQSHLSNRPFECQECNKCFSCQYLLLKHKKQHNSAHACDKCGTSFSKQFFLDLHKKRMHQPLEPIPTFVEQNLPGATDEKDFFACSICGAPFSRLVIMNNHEKKCREESKVMCRLPMGKGYQCKICNKVATLKHNLMVHIRKHEDVVKIDSSGRLFIISEKWSNPDGAEQDTSSMTPFGKLTKRKRSSSFKPRKSLKAQMKSEMEASDPEYMDTEDPQEEEEDKISDSNIAKTPGGWACTICRKKFTDKPTILRHLESHTGKTKDSAADEEGSEPSEQTEKQTISNARNNEESDKSVYDFQENSTSEDNADMKTPKARDSRAKLTRLAKQDLTASAPVARKNPKSLKSKPTEEADGITSKSERSLPSSPSRTTYRPSRTQKIPSRFLE